MSKAYHPLYQTIYDDIINDIKNNRLKPGDKLPTEFEMIDNYGVSRITVSRALQELARNGYIIRYRSKGSFVSDLKPVLSPNKGSFSPSSNNIAFVTPVSSGTIPQMLFAMQHAAQKKGYVISIFNSEKSLKKEREILKQLAAMPLAGIICYPIESYENVSYYSQFFLNGTPLVAVDKTIPYNYIPCIKTDNYRCVYKMAQYLINKGHTRISFYTHNFKDENEKLRFKGYLNALIDNNITPCADYFLEIDKDSLPQNMMSENSSEVHSIIHKQLEHLMSLAEKPTAIFCAFDLIAAYVQQEASTLGISIPDDLSVVGFDNLYLCDHLQVPLTSVAQDFTAMGNKAIELISKQIAGESVESSYLFDGHIIERSSVKALISK